MKKKLYRKYLVGLLVLCIGLMASLVTAQAAANQKTLKAGTTYTTTLTGTKKYKVKYTTKTVNTDDQAMYLYINGKKVKTLKKTDVHKWSVRLITVSSGRKLFFIQDTASNGYNYYMGVYEYKNNKLTLLSNLTAITRNTKNSTNRQLTPWARSSLRSVKKNTLTVRWCDETNVTGYYYQDIVYKISGNKITVDQKPHTLMGPDQKTPVKWTVKRSFKVFQGVGNGGLVFTANPGDVVTGLKVSSKEGTVFFYIRNADGEAGWFEVPPKTVGAYFEEAKFAG